MLALGLSERLHDRALVGDVAAGGDVERYNLGTLPGEEPHGGGADATRAASNDRDLAVQAQIQHGGSVY